MSLWGIEMSQAVLASLIAAVFAIAGTLTVALRDRWARRNRVYFTTFASGILLTTGIMLLPEIMRATSDGPLLILMGYLALYSINVLFSRKAGAIVAPLLAIGIHSYIDGFEYGILFNHDARMGWIASAGLVAHEFAEGVILYTFLRAAKASPTLSFLGAIVGAALTTPAGAVTSQVALSFLEPEMIGMLLGVAAGALIYLGATHLPSHETLRQRKPSVVVTYSLGVALALFLAQGHNHGHHVSHQADHDIHEPHETGDHEH